MNCPLAIRALRQGVREAIAYWREKATPHRPGCVAARAELRRWTAIALECGA